MTPEMERAAGYIVELSPDEATVHLHREGGREGIATLPISMFGDWERQRLRLGTFVEADVDETELVTRINMSQVATWTQDELDAAEAQAKELAAKLRWK